MCESFPACTRTGTRGSVLVPVRFVEVLRLTVCNAAYSKNRAPVTKETHSVFFFYINYGGCNCCSLEILFYTLDGCNKFKKLYILNGLARADINQKLGATFRLLGGRVNPEAQSSQDPSSNVTTGEN